MVYSCIEMLMLNIDRHLDQPVYEQVVAQMRGFIASGALAKGTKIPSVRQLARDLGVSLNTIARAYRRLEEEGFLIIRDRAGVAVAAPAKNVESSTRSALLVELRATLARLRQAGMAIDELLRVTQREVKALEESGHE
jgi:DNA-binding transcriptional regulator YhcF (GntR family)